MMYTMSRNEHKHARIAPDLYARIVRIARAEGRTITAQLAMLLEKAVMDVETKQAHDPDREPERR